MAIDAAAGLPTYTPPPVVEPVGKKELDRSDFMELFITQLQYQDPTKPMDSYEVASQLAQFSTLEATMKMSESMDNLLEYQISQNNLQLLNLLGSEVRAVGNSMTVQDGQTLPTEFLLEEPAESCKVNIYSSGGDLIRQIDLGPVARGTHELAWDAKDSLGNTVEDGMYFYQIDALTPLGDTSSAQPRTTGLVTGLQFNDGDAVLTLAGGMPVAVSDIISVLDNTPGK